MRSNKINYLVVGSFILISLIFFVIAVAWLTGRTGPTEAYHAIYRNVTGVKFGSQVMYEGYPIGQVTEVTPVERNGKMEFRIDFDIIEDWRLPDDSFAQIGASSLLSAISLNITAGNSLIALKPGDRMQSKEAANLFDVMANVATDIAELAETSLKPLLEQLTRGGSVLSDMLEDDGKVIVQRVRELVEDLSLRAPEITDDFEVFANDLERLGVNLNRSADELNEFLTLENRIKVEGVLDHLDRAATSLDLLMIEANAMVGTTNDLLEANQADVTQATNDLRHTAASVSRYVDSINHSLDGAARNMYEFSRQIRQNPGSLLGGTPPADNAETGE
ncbi:MAG: MCE family protein [Rhodospirillales bacterium]|nr:MCE family protein [Rhodospirillales bacterium]